MASSSPFQAATLVARPSYPNSIAWSDENLIAIASGHLVTILNPALPSGPRGVITIPPNKPYLIGVVTREDLSKGCLLPTCLSRDTRPCARSISWSPLGLAPNSGCLLAVCTVEGRVKLYRQPFAEYSAEWIEVVDISDSLFEHLQHTELGQADHSSTTASHEQAAANYGKSEAVSHLSCFVSSKKSKKRTLDNPHEIGTVEDQATFAKTNEGAYNGFSLPSEECTAGIDIATFPCLFHKNTLIEVLTYNGTQRVWVSGKIKRINGTNALVQYTDIQISGKKEEWVELNKNCGKTQYPRVSNGIELDHSASSPKVRPCMSAGYLPDQIFALKSHTSKGILSNGQAVEAWLDNRWVEGKYLGSNEHGLLVELSGENGPIALDARCIRLAPSWNSNLNSWQITLFKIEGRKSPEVVQFKAQKPRGNIRQPCLSVAKETCENGAMKRITAEQYVSWSAMLSSTVVTWSPKLHISSNINSAPTKSLASYFSLLSVGGKSGKISFWRNNEQDRYAVVCNGVSVNIMLVGVLQAHKSWITAICWEIVSINDSKSELLLISGSSDGSVKIWLVDIEGLLSLSEMNCSAICLLREVSSASSAPVSVLSVTAPVESLGKILLAVGRGSGLLEVWVCDISSCEFQMSGSYDAHLQIVTGVTWAFNGRRLYSCSQDDSICCWFLHESTLCQVPLASTSFGLRSSSDLHVTDSCFGLALSQGNLVFATVRGFDFDFLNPMYEVRTQKAGVEFFWIGGQELVSSSDRYLDCVESFPGTTEAEMMCWESCILWSLKHYEHASKPLLVWDVIAALFAVKQAAEGYVQHILVKWILSWFAGCDRGLSTENILFHASRSLSKISSRQLHLLNIICRRFVLSGHKVDVYTANENKLEATIVEDEQLKLWTDLLNISEGKLRERLVAFSFVVVLSQASSSTTVNQVGRNWLPVGIAQMQQWIAANSVRVHNQLQLFQSKLKSLGWLYSFGGYVADEQCRYCSASVPFESPEVAFCAGKKGKTGIVQRHKLVRCAASMQVCPTTPLWYCVCCQRSVSELVPQSLFTVSELPLDIDSLTLSPFHEIVRPLCPFCGILLQRLQPEFLLSASPV